MERYVPITFAGGAIAMALVVALPFAQTQRAQAQETTINNGATHEVAPHLESYVDLYQNPEGNITGSTYIFNPVANFTARMTFDFAHMRTDSGVNAIGFYNLVHLTDSERDVIFTNLERNQQKAIVRIEDYDAPTFDFDDGDPSHADASRVMARYNTDDPVHGYTGLLKYLVTKNRLKDIAYFAVNMPVDDPTVSSHFQTSTYADGRTNPAWASSQVAYADYLITRLREVLGSSKLYLSVFYGWDQSYNTPSYAAIAHPADGYFFNNYSYPISYPPDQTATTALRINQPRLQSGMDRLVAQYPTQPKVVEYGFHTVEYNRGGVPGQTAGLVANLASKTLARQETAAFYQNGTSNGRPFNVRGTLYFAQNLYKEEGNPPSINDWTLDYPNTDRVEAESGSTVQYLTAGQVVANPSDNDITASGTRAVLLAGNGASVEFMNMAAASMVQLRHKGAGGPLTVSVNGATPKTVRLPAAAAWTTTTFALTVPMQGSINLLRGPTDANVSVDWLAGMANYEAEVGSNITGTVYSDGASSVGSGVLLSSGNQYVDFCQGVQAGSKLSLRYSAVAQRTVNLSINGRAVRSIVLPATANLDTYAVVTVPVAVPANATIRLTAAWNSGALRLDYLRVDGRYEAESSGGLYNGGHAVASGTASGGAFATSFDIVGASDVFSLVGPGTTLTIRYSATQDASLTLIINGNLYPILFPRTGGAAVFADSRLSLTVAANTTVIAQRNAGNQAIGLRLDYLEVV